MKSQKSSGFLTCAIFLETILLKHEFVESAITSNKIAFENNSNLNLFLKKKTLNEKCITILRITIV